LKLAGTKLSKKGKHFADALFSFFIASLVIFGYHADLKQNMRESANGEEGHVKGFETKFGYILDSVYIEENTVRKNDVFGNILRANGLTSNMIMLLEHEAKDVFNIRNIRTGAKYHVIKKDECDDMPIAIVYEPDKFRYLVCDFGDDVKVNLVEKEVETCEEIVSGTLDGSLWNSLDKLGVDVGIIDLMEEALSSSVDFYHTHNGDEFKLIFEKKYIDGEYVGIGKLTAAGYVTDGKANYAFYYQPTDKEEKAGYFDFEGRPARQSFLKAPVKFSRISSSYNLKRFHPIKRKTIPHLGTDYAAPYGTEIRSVGDGVVTAATYGSGNGYFVKIRHDKVYETQYLHMSRFAKGIKPGTRVKQGQTIGYVGSTGLATGPHVCFRFWKNGRQVNHLKEKLPQAKPMDAAELPEFFEFRDKLLLKLNNIPDPANPAHASNP